jgi:uncharacterized protein (TIGR02145 family)
VIGSQTWMAENLNYIDTGAVRMGYSACNAFLDSTCNGYAHLYTWSAAMKLDSAYCHKNADAVIHTPHQGICPSGWHIPTDAEWDTLEAYVKANNGGDSAGTSLKSPKSWKIFKNIPSGTDLFGFSAIAAGSLIPYGGYANKGYDTIFWSADESSADTAQSRFLSFSDESVTSGGWSKTEEISVRCIED